MDVTDILLLIFNALLVVFTGLLWWATSGLWKAAQLQSQDMKESLRIAAEATGATKVAADAAYKAPNRQVMLRLLVSLALCCASN